MEVWPRRCRAPVAIAAAIRTWIPVVMAKAPAVPREFGYPFGFPQLPTATVHAYRTP